MSSAAHAEGDPADPSVAVIRRRPCARAGGSQIVRVPGFESWPLRGGTTAWPLPEGRPLGSPSEGPGRVSAPRPALRRVLPFLLPAEHGEVHERVAVVEHLGSTALGPVCLKHPVTV